MFPVLSRPPGSARARSAVLFAAATLFCLPAVADIVDFDDPGLALPPESFWNGSDGSGSFVSRGVTFDNDYNSAWGSWSGFAYSNTGDVTTPGYFNQYSAVTGTGVGPGQDNYGVAFGYSDSAPVTAADLRALPSFILPAGFVISGMNVTNTTYAALSMLNGDGFAKKFGGVTGNDPDWFKLTAYGIGADGNPLAEFVEFYLADFRAAGTALDYVVTDWRFMDLSALAGARSLHFNMSSTDIGPWGLNTPTYFAVDDIQIEPAAVPEPSSFVLLGLVGGSAFAVRRFRGRSRKGAGQQ